MTDFFSKLSDQSPSLLVALGMVSVFIGYLKVRDKAEADRRLERDKAETARWKEVHAEHLYERERCREVTAANTIATTAKLVQEEKTIAALNNLSHVISEKFQ